MSIKNAQMEAQNEVELKTNHKNLYKTIPYVLSEIKIDIPFNKEIQLFQLLRLLSPESYLLHLNRYRDTLVMVGHYICPEFEKIQALVSQLIYNLNHIPHLIIKAIYLHHQLIRIHPFEDGNGRATRIAENWILMYNLYAPTYIKNKKRNM